MNSMMQATAKSSSSRHFKVIRGGKDPSFIAHAAPTKFNDTLLAIILASMPWAGSRHLFWYRVRNFVNIWRGLWRIIVAKSFGITTMWGSVYAQVRRADGTIENYGLISLRVVTDTGVGFIVDAFQNTTELENMKYHGYGSGSTAEAASQTALVTEFTTQYATDNTRPTGSTTEGASANIYRSVATFSPDATVAITEHGIFSQAATGGGVMADRSVFSAINIGSGDSLQTTYDWTFSSGG